MGKANELKTTTALVKKVLEEYPQARNSDDFLYFRVCAEINIRCISLPFSTVVLDRKKYGYPSTETVRRCRQKLQATFPELAGDSNVEGQRMLNEKVFREYAKQ
ncbi:MAG: hypothetical protein IJZ23_07035 [Roseburia sp.]|nr:hypothetical protein [Roseburia sp.]MBQ8279579.1 hypothetical protein [Roseburia sp.]